MTCSPTPLFPRTLSLPSWLALLALAAGCSGQIDVRDAVPARSPSHEPPVPAEVGSAAALVAAHPAARDEDPRHGNDQGSESVLPGPPVYFGDLTISASAEGESFCASGYTSVSGSLRVYDSAASTPGLDCLTSVAVDLEIDATFARETIAPFASLRWIGGDLRVANLPVLQWVDPFPALEAAGGSIEVDLSPEPSVGGLGALVSVEKRTGLVDSRSAARVTTEASMQGGMRPSL